MTLFSILFSISSFYSSRRWKFFRSDPFTFWYNIIKSENDVRSILCFNVFVTLICSTVKFEKYDLILLGSGFQIYVVYMYMHYILITKIFMHLRGIYRCKHNAHNTQKYTKQPKCNICYNKKWVKKISA